jgi:S-adenosylmethionine hydrolase
MVNDRRRRIIALTTDFGLEDSYVGVLRGVILSINRNAVIVDLCHQVTPQNIAEGAFLLETAWRYFPPDTVYLVVVDPGVGSARQAIVVAAPGGTFVAPDNGVLSPILRAYSPDLPLLGGAVSASGLGPALHVARLSNPSYWLPKVSMTFHGRDVFAPVAAHLSLGVSIERLGEPAPTVVLLPATRPMRRPDGTLLAHVIHVDHFGNLITDLSAEEAFALGAPLLFRLRGRVIEGLSRHYAAGPELLALVGSSDRVEIALRNGNAAAVLGAAVGDELEVIHPA